MDSFILENGNVREMAESRFTMRGEGQQPMSVHKRKNAMGMCRWSFEEESISELPDGTWSIGIGNDLEDQVGVSPKELSQILGPAIRKLTQDGAYKLNLVNPHTCQDVQLYVRLRGKAVDFGTRKDFSDLGWEGVCDALDEVSDNPCP